MREHEGELGAAGGFDEACIGELNGCAIWTSTHTFWASYILNSQVLSFKIRMYNFMR